MDWWEGQGQSLDTESFDSGVKGTAVKATGTSGQGWVGGGWACGRQGARNVVETDRVHVYCPAEVLQQEGGWGGEEAAQAETIYLEHEEQLGREANSATFQGQVGCEEGMPSAKAACLLPPTSEFSPTVLAQSRTSWPAIPTASPPLGATLPSGKPHRIAGLSTAEYMVTTHHVPGIAQSFHLMAMGDRGVLHFSEVKTMQP